MENKKINFSFIIVAITFLLIFYIMISDYNSRRINEFKNYANNITNIIHQKNYRLKILAYQLARERKENQDLKNTLSETRNALDVLSKKLAQQAQAPVAIPVTAPAPASAPAAASATK